jgi:hypothetical protein
MKKEIVEQLRWARAWFDVDGDKTIPVDKEYGKWLFQTAADEIERLREAIRNVPGEVDDPWSRRQWISSVLAQSPSPSDGG